MLLKWKCILSNWINCFCNENNSKEVDIDMDTLLDIISCLWKNLCLDDSISSLLEAHSVQEFILEKYPYFKLENGSSEPITQEDFYMTASLLLYFVCVNSKNVDLKKAMCSKLSAADQEIIMKFSKCLMGCPNITSTDVMTAITEACGQDIAGTVDTDSTIAVTSNIVAETPPAVRSLHGEVRRLQAALDAERFDRNYLQEELSRTNLKLDQLTKVKEQYKLEIVNLKAKVSEFCGEDNDAKGLETSHNNSVKLTKQLELLEERLANVQEELSNAEYDRNNYKTKLDDLKRERDKYLALSQQENIRACQLSEELEVERRQCVSLKELVSELRQHNRLNGFDTSQLECDELDASVHSLMHNSSVCSEACANIIEVQLIEERAKIGTLKLQMQQLQDQIKDLNNKCESEQKNFSEILSEKDSNIMDLKHRINEGIERNNLMKFQYDDDITKLNNEINELGQTLKNTTENTRKIIDAKMQEIQILQEEKLSLLESFSNETSKLETKIQELTKEVEVEKSLKLKIRDDYDNHIMKLNEKVLNRNNELVELQDKIVEKGEEIEKLQLQLRNEKDMREELMNKHNNDVIQFNNIIKELNTKSQKYTEEIVDLKKQIQQYCQCLEEMNDLNASLLSSKEDVKKLSTEKQIWLKEKEKNQQEIDEKNEIIISLKNQLQTEIEYKNGVQNKLCELEAEKELLSHEIDKLNKDLSTACIENLDANKQCNSSEQCLVQEKGITKSLNTQFASFTFNIKQLLEKIKQQENDIKLLEVEVTSQKHHNEKLANDFESERLILKNMVSVTESVMEDQKKSLTNEIVEHIESNTELQLQIKELEEMIEIEKEKAQIGNDKLSAQLKISVQDFNSIKQELLKLDNNWLQLQRDMVQKTTKLDNVVKDNAELSNMIGSNEEMINKLKREIDTLTEEKTKVINDFVLEKEDLLNKFKEVQQDKINVHNKLTQLHEDVLEEKAKLDSIIEEKAELTNVIVVNQEKINKLERDIVTLTKEKTKAINDFVLEKEGLLNKFEEVQQDKINVHNKLTQLHEDMLEEKAKFDRIIEENAELTNVIVVNQGKINKLEQDIVTLTEEKTKVINDFVLEKEELLNNVKVAQSDKFTTENNLIHLQEVVADKTEKINSIVKEKADLMNIIVKNEERINELEKQMNILIKEKTKKINVLELQKQQLLNDIKKAQQEKITIEKNIEECEKSKTKLCKQNNHLEDIIKTDRQKSEIQIREKAKNIDIIMKDLETIRNEKVMYVEDIARLQDDILKKTLRIEELKSENSQQSTALTLSKEAIVLLEEKIKCINKTQEEMVSNFETEKVKLKNIIAETQSVMKDQKQILDDEILEQSRTKGTLEEKNTYLQELITTERQQSKIKINEAETMFQNCSIELNSFKEQKALLTQNITLLEERVLEKVCEVDKLTRQNDNLQNIAKGNEKVIESLKEELRAVKLEYQKTVHDFELNSQQFTNKLAILETALKDEKLKLSQNESKYVHDNEVLAETINSLENKLETERHNSETKMNEQLVEYNAVLEELNIIKEDKLTLCENINQLSNVVAEKTSEVKKLNCEKNNLAEIMRMQEELQDRQTDYKTTITCGVKRIIDNLQIEGIYSDVIGKLQEMADSEEPHNRFDTIVDTVIALTRELTLRSSVQEALKQEMTGLEKIASSVVQKDCEIIQLHGEVENLQKLHNNSKIEFLKQIDEYNKVVECKSKEVESLQLQNDTLHNDINGLKIQLDIKIHSLKDKLIDNENITDKLKATYECQIDNLNVMVSKLTNYLKDKTNEMDTLRKDKERLEEAINNSNKAITLLEAEVKSEKLKHETLISEFESERVVLKNLASVTESVMEDQKSCLDNRIKEYVKLNNTLTEQVKTLEKEIEVTQTTAEIKVKEAVATQEAILKELSNIKKEKDDMEKDFIILKKDLLQKTEQIELIMDEKNNLNKVLKIIEEEKTMLVQKQEVEAEKQNQLSSEVANLRIELEKQNETIKKLEIIQETVVQEKNHLIKQLQEKDILLETEKNQHLSQLDEIEKLQKVQDENILLNNAIKEKELEIINIKERLDMENARNQEMNKNIMEQMSLVNKFDMLQEYKLKAEEELTKRQREVELLKDQMKSLTEEYNKLMERNEELQTELEGTKKSLHMKQEAERCYVEKNELKEKLSSNNDIKSNNLMVKTNTDNNPVIDKELTPKYREEVETKSRDQQNQVHDSAFDNTTTSTDSCKTILDLEKIIQDKNRTITTLHSDIKYLKTLIAESENKLMDVTKDLDLSRENCHQLSSQLKKLVYQKNEEIAELKKQVTKMSATETRATQIIKVSAKYQAMIIKRIAEIKNNTVLKELTNFGNSNNCDNELRRSFNAGNITMEDLENFLETTDRHLRRCSEKQIALQKERDRLFEVNKISESEIIAMRKFLMELSVSIKTFNSVKELYTQKLNRVIALQRTIRREILNLEGRIVDATMCKLERGYAAIMQDLSECVLNLERWVDRSIVRSVSPEKIKQAFISNVDRASLVPTSFQNASLDVQLGELESSLQKLLEEVMRAQTGEGAKDAQALTLMEVRAEYEDKLNRMKAKMKELYVDQITMFKEKQKEEIEEIERKLQNAEEKLQESSKAYKEHIRGLTTELWNVGEKFIIQKDEAQWLRKQQKSGSLMSLQHVHSAGLVAPHEEPRRPSDAHSLRSLQVITHKSDKKKEGRGLHMSDEEGEVFDNRCLRELSETPRGAGAGGSRGASVGGARLSELRWRNSLCPPHLKSSYPAETQFAPAIHEEEIKCAGSMSLGGKPQRKEVGITAYKKPGPPTPSKQAGRLSATDSELRESLRVEAEPSARRTATPSRLFSLFRHKQSDTAEGTPRRRLSMMFRKK